MQKRDFTAVYAKQGRWIVAWIEELPGVNTQGRTQKEAKENLRDALSLVLAENKKLSAIKLYDTEVRREHMSVAVSV